MNHGKQNEKSECKQVSGIRDRDYIPINAASSI